MEPGQVTTDDGGETGEKVRLPWHLKLLAAATTVYLGWRAFQGIEWLIDRF